MQKTEKNRPFSTKMLIFIGSVSFLVGPPAIHAADRPWEVGSEISYLNTTGNTRTETFGAKNRTAYRWQDLSLKTQVKALTASENNHTTAENYFASEKVEWEFDKPNYLFELGSWEKDRFSGIDSRLTAGGGYGREIFKTTRHSLTAEAGLQQSWEDRKNQTGQKFGSVRGFGDYHFTISPSAKFMQTVEFLKDFSASGDYRLNTLTAIQSNLTSKLAMKISYEIKYDNAPATGFTKTDTLTSAALVLTL